MSRRWPVMLCLRPPADGLRLGGARLGLAGLSVGLLGLSRFLVSYPVGRITDSYGRKPGILLGLALALAGTLIVGLAMLARNPWALILGMLVFTNIYGQAASMLGAAFAVILFLLSITPIVFYLRTVFREDNP